MRFRSSKSSSSSDMVWILYNVHALALVTMTEDTYRCLAQDGTVFWLCIG